MNYAHLTGGFHEHAHRCNKPVDGCPVCRKAMHFFTGLPLPELSKVLGEHPRPSPDFPILDQVVDKLLDLVEGPVKTKQATRMIAEYSQFTRDCETVRKMSSDEIRQASL